MAKAPKAQTLGTLADGRELVRMLCEVTPADAPATEADADAPPTWIHILPFGPQVEARDGRAFQVSDALALAAKTETPLVIDWDHESEWGKTRAAGWIEELRVEIDDADMPRAGVWGRAKWTPEGRADVAAQAYRFLSPVVLLESESRDAQQIVSVALTNRPALRMHGLDNFRERLSTQFGPFVDEHPRGVTMQGEHKKALFAALGLAPDAADSDAVKAATSHTSETRTLREANSLLTTQLSEAQTKVKTLEGKLTEVTQAEFAAKIERILDDAAKAGKVTPATAKKWREFCAKSADNLEYFNTQILPDLAVVGDPAKPPPREALSKVNGDFSKYGVTEEEAKKAEEYAQKRRASAESEV